LIYDSKPLSEFIQFDFYFIAFPEFLNQDLENFAS